MKISPVNRVDIVEVGLNQVGNEKGEIGSGCLEPQHPFH